MSTNSTTLIPANPHPGALAPVDKYKPGGDDPRDPSNRDEQNAPDLIDFLKRAISSIRSLRQADWLTILNSQALLAADRSPTPAVIVTFTAWFGDLLGLVLCVLFVAALWVI